MKKIRSILIGIMKYIYDKELEYDYNLLHYLKVTITFLTFIIGLIFTFIFSLVAYTNGSYYVMTANFLTFVVFLLLFFRFKKNRNIKFVGELIVPILMAHFLFLISNGGLVGTGYIWSFVFPIIAILFFGMQKGTYYVIVHTILSLVIYLIPELQLMNDKYSIPFILNFFGIYFGIFCVTLVYEFSGSVAQDRIRKKGKKLEAAKKRLNKSVNELESVFANSMIGIVFLKNGRFIYKANNHFCEIFGYQVQELMNKSVEVLYPDREAFVEFGKSYKDEISEKKILNTDLELLKKDGTRVWCRLAGRPLNAHNFDEGVVWIVEDITEAEKNKKELLELERKNSILAMIVTANHEMNQPLTILMGYLEVLKMGVEGAALPKNILETMSKIEDSASEISSILDKYKRAENGHFGIEKYVNDTKMVVFDNDDK